MSYVAAFGTKVQNNKFYRLFVRVGLIVFGLVYGLLGVLVLQIAWNINDGYHDASFVSVLSEVENLPFGNLILIVAATGLFVIAVWQLIECLLGYTHLGGIRRFNRRIASAGRALIYSSVAVLALFMGLNIQGPFGESNVGGVLARLLESTAGRWIVLVIGCVAISIGIGQVGRGLGRIFVDEMLGKVPRWVVALGMIGYGMLGLSLTLIGALVAWSAISALPRYAGTMDTAIHFLVGLPLGSILGTIVAAGFICFAVFCMAWSTRPLHATAQY
ncbi:DUF1206 domain-containing protein [Corynebacterium lubricantis]|uniref:DUF1206 domain-containing protein n=1 Tax=Corynebacterium lubricantis TaxID=541095 RepID=UPI00037119C8|nr:DUF1206 domain-containing protein [Corynebacterium lubricantis]